MRVIETHEKARQMVINYIVNNNADFSNDAIIKDDAYVVWLLQGIPELKSPSFYKCT